MFLSLRCGDYSSREFCRDVIVQTYVGSSKDDCTIQVGAETIAIECGSVIGRFILFVLRKDVPIISELLVEDSQDNRQSAFEFMMASSKYENERPKMYDTAGITKDRLLFNDIVNWLQSLKLGLQNHIDADKTGKAFVTTVRDDLWLIDGHWKTLDERGFGVPQLYVRGSLRVTIILKIKGRKREHGNLNISTLDKIQETLFDATCSYFMKKRSWKSVREIILKLAKNLRKCVAYVRAHETESNAMTKKTAVADEYHTDITKGTPLTSPSEHAMYKLLNEGIGQREPYQPIFLNDFAPISRRRRYEFLEGIKTTTKCQNYSFTGSSTHLHWIWKVPTNDSESIAMSKFLEITNVLRKDVPVYHSRSVKNEFIYLVDARGINQLYIAKHLSSTHWRCVSKHECYRSRSG